MSCCNSVRQHHNNTGRCTPEGCRLFELTLKLVAGIEYVLKTRQDDAHLHRCQSIVLLLQFLTCDTHVLIQDIMYTVFLIGSTVLTGVEFSWKQSRVITCLLANLQMCESHRRPPDRHNNRQHQRLSCRVRIRQTHQYDRQTIFQPTVVFCLHTSHDDQHSLLDPLHSSTITHTDHNISCLDTHHDAHTHTPMGRKSVVPSA